MEIPAGMNKAYVCVECKQDVKRDNFLIEQRNAAGVLAPGNDWQGALWGRCLPCCSGLGPWKEVSCVLGKYMGDDFTDKDRRFHFQKEAKRRHGQRSDTKLRDRARLLSFTLQQLIAEARDASPGLSHTQARKQVVDFLKAVTDDIMVTFSGGELQKRMKAILDWLLHAVDAASASEGAFIPKVQGFVLQEKAEYLQYLGRISANVRRFFICRNLKCNPRGCFFALNTQWVSTTAAGGWQFGCPVCGQQYRAGKSNAETLPAHLVYFFERDGTMVLSAWGNSAEESAQLKLMEALEPSITEEFENMEALSLETRMYSLVRAHAIPVKFERIEMSDSIRSWYTQQNESRSRKLPWSWEHLDAHGITGSFLKYEEGATPIMTEDDAKRMLAMVKVRFERICKLG